MVKCTRHSLKFITAKKRQLLDNLFVEYQRVVNGFIVLHWNEKQLHSLASSIQWRKVNTWLCGKTVKCAYKQAILMIKSARTKNKKRIYKSYQKVYAYAKSRDKRWSIVNQKWSEWSRDKKFRSRVRMPIFKGNSIDLNSNIATVYTEPKNLKFFDLVVKLGSIFGNRILLVLPTKKHSLFNKYISNGYSICSSIRLLRLGEKYYINLFLEKETPQIKTNGEVIGIDAGINKLMSTSDGKFYGKEIEAKIQKLKRRKRGSKNFKRTVSEIKDYIGQQVNKLNLDNVSTVVVEKLDVKNMHKRGKSSREHRKTLGNWNSRLLFGRLSNRCEENRVLFATVEPEYTSQICSSCGAIHQESREGERYKCKYCGASLDADHNASLNIRNRFLNKEVTVPCEQQQAKSNNFT